LHEVSYVEDARLRRQGYLDWWASPHTGYDTYFSVGTTVGAIAFVLLVRDTLGLVLAAFLVAWSVASWFQFASQLAALRGTTPVEVTVRASDEAFEMSSPNTDARYSWREVRRLYVTRRFLWLDVGSSRFGVPRSALSPAGVTFVVDAAEDAGASLRGYL
jgi:hypothetical protein